VTVWLDVLQATEKATERVEDIVAPSLDENKNKKMGLRAGNKKKLALLMACSRVPSRDRQNAPLGMILK